MTRRLRERLSTGTSLALKQENCTMDRSVDLPLPTSFSFSSAVGSAEIANSDISRSEDNTLTPTYDRHFLKLDPESLMDRSRFRERLKVRLVRRYVRKEYCTMNSGYSHRWQQLFWFGTSVISARSLAPGDKPMKGDSMVDGMACER